MKNITRFLLIFFIGGTFLSSCDKDSNWDNLTKDYDPNNSTHYVQLTDAAGSFKTDIADDGSPKDIIKTINVVLMGAPQASDITVTFSKDAATTMTDDMWSLSSMSVVIPAGKSSASVTMTAVAANMIEEKADKLVLNMDAGGVEATSGTQANFTLTRIKFCAWTAADMAGEYAGTDDAWYSGGTYPATFTVKMVDDTHITISGLGAGQYKDAWGEAVTGGDEMLFTVNPNGTFSFENQYMCQTDGVWDYYMGPGGGTAGWDGCKFTMDIPFFAHWDDSYSDTMQGHSTLTKK